MMTNTTAADRQNLLDSLCAEIREIAAMADSACSEWHKAMREGREADANDFKIITTHARKEVSELDRKINELMDAAG